MWIVVLVIGGVIATAMSYSSRIDRESKARIETNEHIAEIERLRGQAKDRKAKTPKPKVVPYVRPSVTPFDMPAPDADVDPWDRGQRQGDGRY